MPSGFDSPKGKWPKGVAIVGSGPAAVGALLAISRIAPQTTITLFDPGKEIKKPDAPFPEDFPGIRLFYKDQYSGLKRDQGLRFPPSKTQFGESLEYHELKGGKFRILKSNFWGGLSNFWGGTMLPFTADDLRNWPIGPGDLDPYYNEVADHVGISGKQDDLNRFFEKDYSNRPPIQLLPGMDNLNTLVNRTQAQGDFEIYSGVNRVALETRPNVEKACVYCGECMGGCFNGSIYNACSSIESFVEKMNIESVPARVLSIDPTRCSLKYEMGNIKEETRRFERIFLCAGCVGSTEILMRSYGLSSGPILVDNVVFQFPILNLDVSLKAVDRNRYFSLTNLIFECEPREDGLRPAQVQVYPNFDYLWRNFIPERLWPLARWGVRVMRDRLLWARAYLHSDHGFAYAMSLNSESNLCFEPIREPNWGELDRLMLGLKSVVNQRPYLIPPVKPIMAKTSSHYGGSLPFGSGLLDISADGALGGGLFLCDSALFPESPSTSLTFTIMANACRIVEMALS
jgi:hypothetical protein